MKKKPASKSAFFNQRVLIGFSFCLLGLVLALMAFTASPGGSLQAQGPDQIQSIGPDNILVLDAIPTQETSAPTKAGATITQAEESGHIDMGALGIYPTRAPLAPRIDGGAMGIGNAFLGITHEVVNQSTPNAFGTLSSGWTLSEPVQFFLNGVLAGTFSASARPALSPSALVQARVSVPSPSSKSAQ